MELRENLTQSEGPLIPKDWSVLTIQQLIDSGFVEEHLDGNHGELYPRSHEFHSYGVPYVSANDFVDGTLNLRNCKFLTEQRAKKFKKGIAKDGDVLFAHNATVGPSALLKTNFSFVILSTTATYFRCQKTKLNNLYFLYALRSSFFVKQYSAVMAQSTRNQLPITTQRKLSLIVPPLPEQTAIATALSDIDALIAQTEKLIEKKKAIKQGMMQQLLSPYNAEGKLKEGWLNRKLGDLGEVKMCRRIFNSETKSIGEIPFYKIGTFGKDPDAFISARLYNEYRHRFPFPNEGDILISAAGTIGRTIRYDGSPAYFQDSNIVWIANNEEVVSNNYLGYIFEIVKYETEGGTIQRLYNNILKSTTFFAPPLPEQEAIATTLSNMDALIANTEKLVKKQKAIKNSMMQSLLTGKIRIYKPSYEPATKV